MNETQIHSAVVVAREYVAVQIQQLHPLSRQFVEDGHDRLERLVQLPGVPGSRGGQVRLPAAATAGHLGHASDEISGLDPPGLHDIVRYRGDERDLPFHLRSEHDDRSEYNFSPSSDSYAHKRCSYNYGLQYDPSDCDVSSERANVRACTYERRYSV